MAQGSDNAWIDQRKIEDTLAAFFDKSRDEINIFGRTVNQTFEAFVFAATVGWYQERGWKVEFHHPRTRDRSSRQRLARLKFSTRGRPQNYSYAICQKGRQEVHVRHQLRVATKFHGEHLSMPANVCLDVAVIEPLDLTGYSSDDYVANDALVTFGEAKHMSAFAELVANFVGLVHEMQPHRLTPRKPRRTRLSPFLYVSGFLFKTAQGIEESIRARSYDVAVFWRTKQLADSFAIPDRPAATRKRPAKAKKPTRKPPIAPRAAKKAELDKLPF